MLEDGEIAVFPESYFAEANCEGDEYLPVSSTFPVMLPMRGMVYRSVVSS